MDPDHVPEAARTFAVTIQKTRCVRLSRDAAMAIGCPDYVEVGYNPDARQVAISPATSNTPGRMRFWYTPSSGQWQFGADSVLRRIGIPWPDTAATYMATAWDGMLVVDLRDEPITRRRFGRDSGVAKNAHAVALGRLGGVRGGRARAERLSPERRREIAVQAAEARWRGPSLEPTGTLVPAGGVEPPSTKV